MYIYWKEQCEFCKNGNPCKYPETKEAIENLKKWERENHFYGTLRLACDYCVVDKEKYYEKYTDDFAIRGE